MKYPNIVTCYVCKAVEPKDFMTLQDFGDHNIQYAHVPSEGRCNAFEIEDGAKVYVDRDGIIRDVDPVNTLIANEREYRAEAESAFTQAIGYAALGTFGLLFALLLIP